MPYIFLICMSFPDNKTAAWRLCYLVPLAFHICGGLAVLSRGGDLPDGNYKELEKSGCAPLPSELNSPAPSRSCQTEA